MEEETEKVDETDGLGADEGAGETGVTVDLAGERVAAKLVWELLEY